MKINKMNLYEDRELKVYKQLLEILKEYSIKFPKSKGRALFEKVIEKNLGIIKNLSLLEEILIKNKSVPIKVQELLNRNKEIFN